jgi:F-box-like
MVASFPPELLLHIFQFFPLKSLLAAKAVNRKWNALAPICSMTPERRELYTFYHMIIILPKFLDSRPYVLSTMRKFDREAYVAMLEGQDGGGAVGRDRTLPAEFRCYILEWPEKAVFGHLWPGMDNVFTSTPTRTYKANGRNELSPTGRICELFLVYKKSTSPYPTVCEADIKEYVRNTMNNLTDEVVSVNALKVWYHGDAIHSWLVVDKERGQLHGCVYRGWVSKEKEIDRLEHAKNWDCHIMRVFFRSYLRSSGVSSPYFSTVWP